MIVTALRRRTNGATPDRRRMLRAMAGRVRVRPST